MDAVDAILFFPQEGWWPYMQRVRAEREAAGYHFMNEAEMQAHLDWLREEEDRIDRIQSRWACISASFMKW